MVDDTSGTNDPMPNDAFTSPARHTRRRHTCGTVRAPVSCTIRSNDAGASMSSCGNHEDGKQPRHGRCLRVGPGHLNAALLFRKNASGDPPLSPSRPCCGAVPSLEYSARSRRSGRTCARRLGRLPDQSRTYLHGKSVARERGKMQKYPAQHATPQRRRGGDLFQEAVTVVRCWGLSVLYVWRCYGVCGRRECAMCQVRRPIWVCCVRHCSCATAALARAWSSCWSDPMASTASVCTKIECIMSGVRLRGVA